MLCLTQKPINPFELTKRVTILLVVLISVVTPSLANFRAFVRTHAGSTLAHERFKNHVLIRNAEDDGYLIMAAVVKSNGTKEYWNIRLISVSHEGDSTDWSYDYGLLQTGTFPLSTTPFAVIPNKDTSGYVICGGWQDHNNLSLRHEGIQQPFYMEIDKYGNVLKSHRGSIDNGTMGFVPLSIEHSESGYFVAGVKSDDFECVSCGRKSGRVAKIDSNFKEYACMAVTSNYTITPSTPPMPGNSSYFDALSKIKRIPGSDDYIISGSITYNISDSTTCGWYGEAGISSGYIARIDSSLSLIWENTFDQNGSLNPDHSTIPDFAIDTSTSSIYYPNQFFGHQTGNPLVLHLNVCSISTGTTSHTYLYENHPNYHSNFVSNIFYDENDLWVCGYANDRTNKTLRNEMMPLYFCIDKDSFYVKNSTLLDANNSDYPSITDVDCYLCGHYNITNNNNSDVVELTGNCGLNEWTKAMSNLYSPIIYSASGFNYHLDSGLTCVVPHLSGPLVYQDTFSHASSPQFFPAIFYSIDSTACYYIAEELELLDEFEAPLSASTLTTTILQYSSMDSSVLDSTISNSIGYTCDSTVIEEPPPLLHDPNTLTSNFSKKIDRVVMIDLLGREIYNGTPDVFQNESFWISIPKGLYVLVYRYTDGSASAKKIIHQ